MNLKYIEGLGNQHQTEAHKGALPKGRNSPQRAPLGLYAEKFSATAFTAPRAQNYRSWFYRIQPSVVRVGFRPLEGINLQTAPFSSVPLYPDPLRWSPFEIGSAPKDFLDGLFTLAACGDAAAQQGAGIHLYCANKSMGTRYFQNSDGELLIVPQTGKLVIHTECGILEVEPGWIAVIPRGIAFRVDLPDGPARGYVCENYGMAFQLPELGPIGSDGLANPRDFEIPVA
ncbi:MAG: homogentisate 1,2-dioxygenase, partial [Lacipirellulaceae bacterium]